MSTTYDDKATFKDTVTLIAAPVLPDGCIDADHVEAGAGIEASKLDHQHRANYSQESATVAASGAWVRHTAKGAGTLQEFKCGVVVACIGDSTITVDLLKNGVSILTAAVVLDNGDAAYAKVAGTIDTATFVTGDVFEVKITATVGTGTLGKGVFAYVDIDEAYQ